MADLIGSLQDYFEYRRPVLSFYSPYTFLRDVPPERFFAETVRAALIKEIEGQKSDVHEIRSAGESHFILLEKQEWESAYWNFPVFKIMAVLFRHDNYDILRVAINDFSKKVPGPGKSCYYFEIPPEDNLLIQAFNESGFRLVETRLGVCLADVQSYSQERFAVRRAVEKDIENLRKTAAAMRNPYDRVHSDVIFSADQGDRYIAEYAEQAVRGFSDVVLVPAADDSPPDAFAGCNYPQDILGRKIANFSLTAVSNKTRKGWLKKLISEMIHILKEKGAEYIITNTQAQNMASLKSLESAGFRLYSVKHVISLASPPRP
jgi:dTDP-4-amino-4,6-dideoxy-D-galactose acyltransferase